MNENDDQKTCPIEAYIETAEKSPVVQRSIPDHLDKPDGWKTEAILRIADKMDKDRLITDRENGRRYGLTVAERGRKQLLWGRRNMTSILVISRDDAKSVLRGESWEIPIETYEEFQDDLDLAIYRLQEIRDQLHEYLKIMKREGSY